MKMVRGAIGTKEVHSAVAGLSRMVGKLMGVHSKRHTLVVVRWAELRYVHTWDVPDAVVAGKATRATAVMERGVVQKEGRGRVGLGLAGFVRVKEARDWEVRASGDEEREREGLKTKTGVGNKVRTSCHNKRRGRYRTWTQS